MGRIIKERTPTNRLVEGKAAPDPGYQLERQVRPLLRYGGEHCASAPHASWRISKVAELRQDCDSVNPTTTRAKLSGRAPDISPNRRFPEAARAYRIFPRSPVELSNMSYVKITHLGGASFSCENYRYKRISP